MWEMMTLNVINQPTNATAKLSAIANICKYRRLHEGHHFIPMTMEVHNTLRHDMDLFIKVCVHIFHDRRLKGHLSLSFCIQFFKQCVSITFLCVLAFAIKRKIVLVNDVCSKPPITIRFHNLHASDIRRVVGEIISYHERD